MAKIGSSNDHQRHKRMVRAGNKLVRESDWRTKFQVRKQLAFGAPLLRLVKPAHHFSCCLGCNQMRKLGHHPAVPALQELSDRRAAKESNCPRTASSKKPPRVQPGGRSE